MKRKLLFTGLMSLLMFVSQSGWGQGLEDFTNSNATTSYADNSFVGNNGITWSYVASRDGNGDANSSGINLPALMLRRVADASSVGAISIPGGIGNFSVKLYKGFIGGGDRQVELFINGISKGTSTVFDDYNEHTFEVNDINIAGDFDILITNTTSKQIIVDDITWTLYTSGGNTPPSITNIVQNPSADITSSTTVSISADITDSDGTIATAELHWGTTSGSLTNTITMTPGAGDSFIANSDIPAQSNGTTVFYEINALDNDAGETTTSEQNYVVTDPATTTIPYTEDFTSGFGDTYTYSVSGTTKVWSYSASNGYVYMNGYNSGDLEEDWLILPGVNLNNYTNEVLTFSSWYNYGTDDADNYLKLYYSTNYAGIGDPSSSVWTELSYTQPSATSTWTGSGDIDLSGISGTLVWIALKYNYNIDKYRSWQIDNFNIFESLVDNPVSFVAASTGTDQIELTFAPNGNSDNVVIVYNADGVFSEPSGALPAVGQAFAGGTLLYNGTTSPLSHTGLTPEQTVYYKAFSVNSGFYSAGLEANATTDAIPVTGLLLEENFDYPIGDLLTNHGWTSHSGEATNPIEVTDGLYFEGYAGSGFGGSALVDNTGEDVNKIFPAQTSGTVYTAFLVNTSATNSAGYFLHLGQTTIGTTFFTRVWVNATGDGLGIGSSAPASYVPITAGTTTLVVIKYDIASKISSLFVFNAFPITEPGTADATFTETATLANVGSIALRQFNPSENLTVDGIRVATSWADAVAAGGGNMPPAITNIVQTPATGVLPTQTVSVSADITDSDGAVQLVVLNWGTTSGNLTNSIAMNLTSGSTYTTVTEIPEHVSGATVFYAVTATDDLSLSITTPEQSYTVVTLDPVLVLNPTSLSGFNYLLGEGPSNPLTYQASAFNFAGSGSVTLDVTDDYEISVDNIIYYSSLILQYTGGELIAQPRTIYVRLKEGLDEGVKVGSINHTDVNIGEVDLPLSGVVTTITQMATIADLRAGATDGTLYELTGEAILTFQTSTRHQKYIQDATAAIMIDDSPGIITTAYNLYDGITGITGTLTLYNGLLEFVPTMDPGAATSTGNTVTPVEVTLADLDDSYQAQLIKVNAVDFSVTGNFVAGINYDITDPSGTGVFRTQYSDVDYIGTLIPEVTQNITGVLTQYNTTMQLVARSLSDFENANPNLPAIAVNPATLSGFTYEVGNGPSAEQSFTIGGQNLTANISIAASDNYEISTGTGGSFVATDPIVLTQTGGVVEATSIYVRLKASLDAGSYSGEQLIASSTDASDKTITLNGSVTNPGGGGLLLVDNFDYTIGTNLTDNGWEAHSGTGTESPTVTNGLIFTGYAGTDIGGAALLDNNGEDVHRTFNTQSSGIVYAAFMVEASANTSAGYFLHFASNPFTTTYFTRIWVNETGDGLGIGAAPDTYVPIATDQPTLAVVKFDFATQISSLFVFNTFPESEPATADAEYVETATLDNLGSIGLRQFNAGEHVIIDGIRVATTWGEAVAPAGGTPVVASPSFNPPSGNYLDPIDVTISTSTSGATLHYSDVSDTGPWTAYTTPINLTTETTLWAYGALDGYDDSPVSSATYTFNGPTQVATIAELRLGSTDGTVYQLTGEAILTFQTSTRHQKYIQDATAAIMIDDSPGIITTTYNLYDGITGITGTLTLYQNMLEFVPTEDPGDATSTGNTVTPVEVALSDLDDTYQAQLVKVYSVDFIDEGDFLVSTNYDITDPVGSGVFRTQYADVDYIGTPIPTELQDITCVVLQYSSTMQLVARSQDDFNNSSTTDPIINTNTSALTGFTYIEGNGPSASQTYELSALNLIGTGDISVTVPDNFEISEDDTNFESSLIFAFADGVITGQPITVYVRMNADLAIGLYDGVITHSGGGAPDKLVNIDGEVTGELIPSITSEIMPQFIEGLNGTNIDRIPFAFQATLSYLLPNTTYRFINQVVITTDDPTTNGAGNVIFVTQTGDFYRTSSPNLGDDGAYGILTTDDNGSYTGWFITEPTGNARFTPGNEVFMRIRLNDGADGTDPVIWLTTTNPATVLTFGVESDPTQGTAVRATSGDMPKGFAFLYDNVNRDGRPIAGTSIETTGVAFADISQYSAFYREDVTGVDGSWGTIIPNVNESGIQTIEIRDLTDGSILKTYQVADGIWAGTSTVNPSGGTDEILVIDLIEVGLIENQLSFKVWSNETQLMVESTTSSRISVEIFNLMGQPMMKKELEGQGTHRFVHYLATGVYVIRLYTNEGMATVKILIRN